MVAILASAVVAYLQVKVNKASKASGLPTVLIVVLTTLAVAALYVAFEIFAPVTIQEAVLAFTTRTFAIQWLLYELYEKHKK